MLYIIPNLYIGRPSSDFYIQKAAIADLSHHSNNCPEVLAPNNVEPFEEHHGTGAY